jgi:hypothetical protein
MTMPRVVAIGIDAADANLVRKWAAARYLPTRATLADSGLVAPIATSVRERGRCASASAHR